MPYRWSAFVLASLSAIAAVHCANGNPDPGIAKDNCKLRDCGSAVGGYEIGGEEPWWEEDSGEPEDAGCTIPTGGECGTFPQCGCTGSQSCDITESATGKTSCVASGAGRANEECTDTSGCLTGFTCKYGVCLPYCARTSDCTESGSTAICKNLTYSDQGTLKDIPGMTVCTTQCDPMNPSTSCGADRGCVFTAATTTTCSGAGDGTTAASCATNRFACAPGYLCVGTGDCRRFCRMGIAGDCPAGKTCGKLTLNGTSTPMIGTTEFGVCAY
jgi:hypothetical protein